MVKFKTGDRIRVRKSWGREDHPVGATGVIVSSAPSGSSIAWDTIRPAYAGNYYLDDIWFEHAKDDGPW